MNIPIWVFYCTNHCPAWSNHITKTAAKASQVFNFLRHNLSNCSSSVKASAYLTIVRPIMEYTSSVWDPHQQCNIQAIEKIQRRAARWVMSDYGRHSSVSGMLQFLNWPTLESRRRISRLKAIYKKLTSYLVYLYHPTFYQHNIQPDTITQIILYIRVHVPVTIKNRFFPEQLLNGTIYNLQSVNIDVFTNQLLDL